MPQFKCPTCGFISVVEEQDPVVLIVCKNCGHVFEGKPTKEEVIL